MRQKATVGGRSFFFNALFVLFNLIGLSFVVLGSHNQFENYFVLFSFIGYLLIAISASGLLIFQGRLMMANVARVIVGTVFIVSGLIKANDPVGFSYKLAEYFEDGALAYRIKELFGAPGFSLEHFMDNALFLSVVICVLEIVLGVLTLIGGKIKLVSYLLLFMMFFFTFLTWHTASCDSSKMFVDRDSYEFSGQQASLKIKEGKTNKNVKVVSMDSKEVVIDEKKHTQCVTDCGCFGDAMKGSVGRSLTPNESFWKDVVLLYLVCWIFIAQWIIEPNDTKRNIRFLITSGLLMLGFSFLFNWYFLVLFGLIALIGALWVKRTGGVLLGNHFGSTLIVTFLSGIFITYVLMYEPLKDFRPYAKGSDLARKMKDGVEGKYQTILIYKNVRTGEKIEYLSSSQEYSDSKIWEDKNWKFLKNSQKVIVPTRIASISDQFNPFLDLADLSDIEKKLDAVKIELKSSLVKGLNMLEIASNKQFQIAQSDYSLEDYPSEYFSVLDTIVLRDPVVTGVNLREYIVTVDRILVLSVSKLSAANWNNIDRYKDIFSNCKKQRIPFIVICSGSRKEIDSFRKKYSFNVPIFVNDETELKAIARSNPALLIIEKGIVKGKYPHRSTPSFNWMKRNIFGK